MTDTTPPTPRAPVRWRVEPGIGTPVSYIRDGGSGYIIGRARSLEIGERIVADHNTLLDVLDLAERGAPAFQIAELIRDVFGLGAPPHPAEGEAPK